MTKQRAQDNDQAKSSRKIIVDTLKKVVQDHKSYWDMKLDWTLWSFKSTFKATTMTIIFRLVSGKEVAMPIMELLFPR